MVTNSRAEFQTRGRVSKFKGGNGGNVFVVIFWLSASRLAFLPPVAAAFRTFAVAMNIARRAMMQVHRRALWHACRIPRTLSTIPGMELPVLPEKLEELRGTTADEANLTLLHLARPTRRRIEEAKVLHPAFYTDQSYAQIERERLFGMNWFAAAHVHEVSQPGDVKVVEVGKTSIILTRDKNYKLHAFYNSCRHRGARVCSTSTKGCKQLVCPYHWWAYRLDGSLKATPPAAMAKELRKEDLGLHRVPGVETFAGIVFLNQLPYPPPLRDCLGDLPEKLKRYDLDDLELFSTKNYDIGGDWKLIAENFVDFYHIDAVHPELSRFSRVDDHLPYQGDGQYVGFVTSPLTDCGGPGDSIKFGQFARLREVESKSALFFHIFPNISVTIYPHSVYTLLTLPSKTPGRTEEQLTLLMAPEARKSDVSEDEHQERCSALFDFVTNINDEDMK
eukprot:s777_g4.t2